MPPTFTHDGMRYKHGDIVEVDLRNHSMSSVRFLTGRLILERSSNINWYAFVVATEIRRTPEGVVLRHGGSRPSRHGETEQDGGVSYPAYEMDPQDYDMPRFKFYDSWCIGNVKKLSSSPDVWTIQNQDFVSLRLVTTRENSVETLAHLITNRKPITLHRDGQNIKTLTTTR